MKATHRYQNGRLYEEHGAWYVQYRQRIAQEDGSSKLGRASKHLGRTQDFANIFDVGGVGRRSCKSSIAIGSAQIRE
jgi:hypothetical protein